MLKHYELHHAVTEETQVFTSKELQEIFRVTPSTIRHWVKKGYVARNQELHIRELKQDMKGQWV